MGWSQILLNPRLVREYRDTFQQLRYTMIFAKSFKIFATSKSSTHKEVCILKPLA